ncbi:GNAT family N-acetyltransferase [Haladaptatus sp. DFWS20]|uniref:GNAT family N-acetyltransferase n=1 Tax=Haladaptatus sp. DFWS20 TaxID=3403467 RepID=UPI003EBBC709
MEYAILGWPEDGPTLRLDHEEFSYAGKFVMSNSGKAVARQDGELLAAIAFNEDRTDEGTMWLRYVTVRINRRGDGIGSELARFTTGRIHERGYRRVRIAVNNPFAYQALYRAGFSWTGEETGLAELVLEYPAAQSPMKYQSGLDVFRDRDLSADEESFLAEKRGSAPPSPR